MSQGQTVNFDSIPDSLLLEPMMYQFEVEDLQDTHSKAGNRMFKATFRVADGTYTGTPLFEYFTIGNEGDPEAKNQETWDAAPGARRLKRLFKATMIPMVGTIETMVEATKSQHFIGAVEQKVDTSEGQYKGTKKNVISAFYPLSRGTGAAQPAGPAPARPAGVPKAAGKAAAAPTITCPYCNEAMTRAEYSGHVKSKHPDEA